MIERAPQYYTAGYDGEDPRQSPLYLRALIFDGEEGEFNSRLIKEFNDYLDRENKFSENRLNLPPRKESIFPRKIIVINASHDNLPTSYETARIFENFCCERKYPVKIIVVNTREELLKELKGQERNTLVISQCVDRKVYNTDLAEDLERKGVVVVPGKITAPGSVFSDKDSTYQLLSKSGKYWNEVARYKKISVENKRLEEVVHGILKTIEELESEIGEKTFFVKPHEGGGGLGGFRITKMGETYIIPDLSKVSGEAEEIHPTFIDIDVTDTAKLREILWIYRLFASDRKLSKNYLKVNLPVFDEDEATALSAIKEYLSGTEEGQRRKLIGMAVSYDEAHARLVKAIGEFEKKFKKKYVPLVNEHIDFGLWGLRAHYRFSLKGPVLETMYHRIFQLGFTEEGLGYLGSDNISNKQTGDLEILRLGPVNEIMLESIGGKNSLFATLLKGASALVDLSHLVLEEEKNRVPLRLQLDLAAVSSKIGEGNADTARGLCLASSWPLFVRNAEQWLGDSLAYYSFKKNKKR
ncbi:MAG: hypothetical protein ABIH85_00180 [Candidatus Omnitrophota bacterium]